MAVHNSKGVSETPENLVSIDIVNLSLHMDCCYRNRSKFFDFYCVVDLAKSIVSGHLVTVALMILCIVVVF